MKRKYLNHKIGLLCAFAVLLILSSCEPSKVDPFDPVYDLGLVPATPGDLVDGSTTLPSYFTGTLPNAYTIPTAPVGDQKRQGSCIGFSAGYTVMSYYINRSNGGSYSNNFLGSPKFLYNLCKLSGCDRGSTYPRAMAILKTKGICSWSDMPYTDYECSQIPSAAQNSAALRYRIRSWSYLSISDIDKMKRLLYSGYPLMIGIRVYTNFYQYRTGVYNSLSGTDNGGHAVAIIGYDDARQAFRIQNSWGTAWGESGYMWVGYNFLAQQLTAEPRCYLVVPDF